MPDIALLDRTGSLVTPGDTLEMTGPSQFHDFCVVVQRRVGGFLDPRKKVRRHARIRIAADEDVHSPGRRREKHRRLPRRVSSAHYDDIVTLAELRLEESGHVVDAAPLEAGQILT